MAKDYKNKNDLDNIYYQSSDWDDQTLFRLRNNLLTLRYQ